MWLFYGVPFLMKELNRESRREKERENLRMEGSAEGEKASHPSQSTKLQRDLSMLLLQENMVREPLGDLNLFSGTQGHSMRGLPPACKRLKARGCLE